MDWSEGCEVGDLKTPSVIYKRRSSFFNLPSEESDAVTPKKEKYIERLTSEKKDWSELLLATHKRVKSYDFSSFNCVYQSFNSVFSFLD